MLLEGLYILAKILVLYLRGIYYKDPVVINEPFAEIKQPTILVSNHPNTLLDPLFAAATVSAQVKFLANYSLYKSRFGNWFFSTFYCIPVQRPEDVLGGATDNQASLDKSHQFIAGGGTLYIAAEGYSIRTVGLRPLKTGAARIGLATESENDWKTNVQILPIGLNYDHSDRFRSNLVIHVGKPFDLKKWKQDYIHDERESVMGVTDHLAEQMKSVLLHADPRLSELMERIRSYWLHMRPIDPKREYLRTRKLLFELQSKSSAKQNSISNLVDSFEEGCKQESVSSEHIAQALYDETNPIRVSELIWSLPVTIFGFLMNVIPYLLCHSIEKKWNKFLVYKATFRVLPSLIFFPLMYLGWMWVVSWLTDSVILTLGSIVLYRRSGIYAWHQIKAWSRYFRSRKIQDQNKHLVIRLSALLNELKLQNL